MDQQNQNPLAKYFRAPGVSLRLPSNGRYQPEGNIKFTATGEVMTYPMRAADEMLLKSPDALMSGMAVESLLRSCVPDLKDPLKLPAPDVDALLLAIRASTYGPEMTIESTCPSCGHENAFGVNVLEILDTVDPLEDEYPVRLSDELVAYVRPFNYQGSTKINMAIFTETSRMKALEVDDSITPEAKQREINAAFVRMNNLNVQLIADCVEKVVTPESTVTDSKFIHEFIHGASKDIFDKIEEKLKDINQAGVNRKHEVSCTKCSHQWETEIEFDPASFFGEGS